MKIPWWVYVVCAVVFLLGAVTVFSALKGKALHARSASWDTIEAEVLSATHKENGLYLVEYAFTYKGRVWKDGYPRRGLNPPMPEVDRIIQELIERHEHTGRWPDVPILVNPNNGGETLLYRPSEYPVRGQIFFGLFLMCGAVAVGVGGAFLNAALTRAEARKDAQEWQRRRGGIRSVNLAVPGRPIGKVNPLWVMFVIGSVFTFGAAGLFGMAYYLYITDRTSASFWGPGLLAVPSVVAGIIVLAAAILRVRRRRTLRRAVAKSHRQPWLVDYGWDSTGCTDAPGKAATRRWIGIAVFAVIATILNVLAARYHSRLPAPFIPCAIGITIFIFTYILVLAVRTSRQQKYFGTARVTFARFPFFLGEQCEMWLQNDRGIRQCERLNFKLRCVRERRVTVWSPEGGEHPNAYTYAMAGDQLWAQVQPSNDAGDLRPGGRIHLLFRLPPEAQYATNLIDDEPQYWELLVTGETDAADYAARFLVPVYARS